MTPQEASAWADKGTLLEYEKATIGRFILGLPFGDVTFFSCSNQASWSAICTKGIATAIEEAANVRLAEIDAELRRMGFEPAKKQDATK